MRSVTRPIRLRAPGGRRALLGGLMLLACLAAAGAHAQNAPRRVVCIGGALTEIVYALGAADRLVAVDTTSVFPAAARNLPQVGYQRTLSAEGILAQTPDLVIATADAGPQAALRQIRDAGVKVEPVPVGYSPQALDEKVKRVAAALGAQPQGEALLRQIAQGWQRLHGRIAASGKRTRVLFILAHGGPAVMVAGRDTAAHAMIELAGGRPGPQIQGRSMLPLFKPGSRPSRTGSRAGWRKSFLVEYWAEQAMPWLVGMSYKAVRTDRWKYIHWVNRARNGELDELYDLERDPYELVNLNRSRAAAPVREKLRRELRKLVADAMGL